MTALSVDNNNSPKLRVGLLMESLTVPRWVHSMLKQIRDCDYASIELVVLNESPAIPSESLLLCLWKKRKSLAFIAYSKLDQRVFSRNGDALDSVDSQPLLDGVTINRVNSKRTTGGASIDTCDIPYLEEKEIDVFVRVGFRSIDGSVLEAARFGVWSYEHGDRKSLRRAPPGFWEIFEVHGTVGTVLQVNSRNELDGLVLDRTSSATDTVSVTRNLNVLYRKSLSMLPRQLQQLYRQGGEDYFARAQRMNRDPEVFGERIYQTPSNMESVVLFVSMFLWLVRLKVYSLFMIEQWILLFRFSEKFDGAFCAYDMLLPPKDRFWADPFPVVEDGKHYVFFEEYLNETGRGHISVMEINPDGSHSAPIRVVEEPYHLSYPYIFRWDNRYYMIPESFDNGTIDLYVCDEFPNRWRRERTLMSGVKGVDSTLVQHAGKWWMFVNLVENEGASTCDELFLFHAPSPVSDEWTAHPFNPVISDSRQSRPAGFCFDYAGMLIRPSQESSRSPRSKLTSSAYGNKLVFNEIVELSETDYRERRLITVATDWHRRLVAIHTFNRAGRLNTADAKLWRWRWW